MMKSNSNSKLTYKMAPGTGNTTPLGKIKLFYIKINRSRLTALDFRL
jgi:hypothetical protein